MASGDGKNDSWTAAMIIRTTTASEAAPTTLLLANMDLFSARRERAIENKVVKETKNPTTPATETKLKSGARRTEDRVRTTPGL